MSQTLTLYGIPHCDRVKAARAWLAAQGVSAVFHDFKTRGVPPARLPRWIDAVGWERLLNRQGSTWRRLDADHQPHTGRNLFGQVDGTGNLSPDHELFDSVVWTKTPSWFAGGTYSVS